MACSATTRTPEFCRGPHRLRPGREPIMYEGRVPAIEESRRRQETLLVFVRVEQLSGLTQLPTAQRM